MEQEKEEIKMNVELLQSLSLISYIFAGIFLLLSIITFFAFGIPKLIGEISGSSARKAIEEIKKQNEEGYVGRKVVSTKASILADLESTCEIEKSEKREDSLGINMDTAKIATGRLIALSEETMLLYEGSDETTLLKTPENSSGETTLLWNATTNESYVEVEEQFYEIAAIEFIASTEIIY